MGHNIKFENFSHFTNCLSYPSIQKHLVVVIQDSSLGPLRPIICVAREVFEWKMKPPLLRERVVNTSIAQSVVNIFTPM